MEEQKPIEKSISSFELTKNTKGYSWNIKVYHEDIKMAMLKAEEIDGLAKLKFLNHIERKELEDQRRREIQEHHAEESMTGNL